MNDKKRNINEFIYCGCGGAPKVEQHKVSGFIFYEVRCPFCGIAVHRPTEDEAIRAWNTAMTPRCCMTCVHWHMCCCCDETEPREVCENWEGW